MIRSWELLDEMIGNQLIWWGLKLIPKTPAENILLIGLIEYYKARSLELQWEEQQEG